MAGSSCQFTGWPNSPFGRHKHHLLPTLRYSQGTLFPTLLLLLFLQGQSFGTDASGFLWIWGISCWFHGDFTGYFMRTTVSINKWWSTGIYGYLPSGNQTYLDHFDSFCLFNDYLCIYVNLLKVVVSQSIPKLCWTTRGLVYDKVMLTVS